MTILWPSVGDYTGEPVPEETFTHLHLSWSLIIHQSFCTTSLQVLFWYGTLHFILHFFTQSLSSFRNTCLIPSPPVLL